MKQLLSQLFIIGKKMKSLQYFESHNSHNSHNSHESQASKAEPRPEGPYPGKPEGEEHKLIENLLFHFVDQCKFLFFPEQWNPFFLDFSKNDVFALLFVYRRQQVNMTEIAEYLNAPLNTATGVVSRLEKRELVQRERSREDKRVVTIHLTGQGRRFLQEELSLFGKYYFKLVDEISQEEKLLLIKVAEKVFRMLNQDFQTMGGTPKTTRQVRHITIE